MRRLDPPHLITLPPERTGEAIEVLADAFRDYPVMRFVLGGAPAMAAPVPEPAGHQGGRYDEELRLLITFFVMARVLRREPVLAVELETGDGPARLAGVATLTLPGSGAAPPSLDPYRERTWSVLGEAARARYEQLGLMWSEFHTDEPHCHLNMIGVRRAHAGQGIGRILLDEVHRISREDPESLGVTLTTEAEENVILYRHLGYRVTAEGQVPGVIRTWGMFRPT
jgi:ribosomal protein S18 acetylase RimI-like enzyme